MSGSSHRQETKCNVQFAVDNTLDVVMLDNDLNSREIDCVKFKSYRTLGTAIPRFKMSSREKRRDTLPKAKQFTKFVGHGERTVIGTRGF